METSQIQSGTKIDNGIQMFNTVQNRLNQLNVSEVISSFMLTDVEKISEEQFEVLGGISYFMGLDFYSMNTWNNDVMTNVLSRLLLNKIDASIFNKFLNVLDSIKENNLLGSISQARLLLMDKIKSEIIFDNDKTQQDLMISLRNIIDNALVPIEITQDLNQRFYDKNYLNYHDILVFNSFAYSDSIFNEISSKHFVELSNNKIYIKALDDASNYFELQKFGLFYEESFLNFYNKNITNSNVNFSPEFFTFFLTNENIKNYGENKDFTPLRELISEYFELNIKPSFTEEAPIIKISDSEEETNNVEVKPLTHSVETLHESISNPLEDPTNVIKHILFDFNKIRSEQDLPVFDFKNKSESLVELVESMLEVEDVVGSFYTFLSKYNELKKTNGINVKAIEISEFLNYSKEDLQNTFEGKIAEIQEKYKTTIAKYVSEISEENLLVLVKHINKIISNLYVGNAEDKGIIFSQISENTIFTNKHLHQMIATIENQYIFGNNIKDYVEFKLVLETEFPEIVKLFEDSQELESYEIRIKLLHIFNKSFD